MTIKNDEGGLSAQDGGAPIPKNCPGCGRDDDGKLCEGCFFFARPLEARMLTPEEVKAATGLVADWASDALIKKCAEVWGIRITGEGAEHGNV